MREIKTTMKVTEKEKCFKISKTEARKKELGKGRGEEGEKVTKTTK